MKKHIIILILSVFFFHCGKGENSGVEDTGWNDVQDTAEGFEVNIVPCDPNPCNEQNRTVCAEKDGIQYCLCDEGYYSDKSNGACIKIEEPAGKEQKTVSNEYVSAEVTVADYKGRVSLPLVLSGCNVSSYFGEDSPVGDDGKFELKMNTEATGLISFKNIQGNTSAFIVFPKSAYLRNENPEINALNVAASMVFMQPGITMTDPLLSAILLEAIKTFDEIKEFAGIIESKISKDPHILSKNDPEIVTALSKAVDAILNYKPQTELALKISGIVQSDTCSDLFCDSDKKDGDKVSVEAKIDKDKKTADLNVTNYLSRWVFFYIDKKNSTNPVLCESSECLWAGAVSPRKFELPTIKALIVDAIVKNLGGAIWNLFTGKSISEILEEILNNAVTAVTKNFAPTDNSFSADLSGLENSLFTSYSMGKGMTSASDYRWITPAFLTGLTELILPGLEIAVDLGFTKITLKSKKDMEGMAKLTELLISKFSYDLTDIFLTASVEKDYFKASGKLIDFFIKIATEPEFYKWLSKYGPISGSKLGNMVANAITDVINKVYNPLAWIDTGIKLGNFLFSGVKIVEIVAVEDYKDQYFIKLPVCKPNCTNKECGDNGCGGSCGTCTGGKTCQSGKCVTGGCWPDCPEMVTVAAGKFWMGCNEAVDNECDPNEYPYHEVYLDAYEIDITEVTVSAYGECVSGGGCTNPSTFSGYCNWEKSGKESHPVNCVTWYQSDEYCKWAGKRLCTEAEWEKAARGTDGRKFPWGNEPASCEYAVMDDGGYGCGTDSTMAVGSKPKGASPYGAMDMAGNVWEWVNDWYDSDYYSISPASNPKGPESGSDRVVRGGSFHYYGVLRVSYRYYSDPSFVYGLGFRCCRSK